MFSEEVTQDDGDSERQELKEAVIEVRVTCYKLNDLYKLLRYFSAVYLHAIVSPANSNTTYCDLFSGAQEQEREVVAEEQGSQA